MRRTLIIVAVVIAAALLIYYWAVAGYYNRFVSLQEEINQAQAEIDNQLQRRFDLIPNLVETVKGFAEQERSILEEIANARSKYAGAMNLPGKLEANAELSSLLARLLVIVENYPTLKSDAVFTRLMDELAGTENRIAVARKRYNDAAREYNVAVRRFPGNIVAGVFGFNKTGYFEIPEVAKQAPKVEFERKP